MLKELNYWKMTGSGNDFIMIDNFDRKLNIDDVRKIVPKVCARGLSIGANGLIMIEPSDEADFKWHFFNEDGSSATMCGNGSRCAARFAYLNKRAEKNMRFLTDAGIIEAEILKGTNVKVQLTPPAGLALDKELKTEEYKTYSFVNTGVPHVVIFEDNIEGINVDVLGRKIRNNELFSPYGTNVNFIKITDKGLRVRTYERGVEGETLACGTGATASVLVCIEKGLLSSPVKVLTSGKIDLKVYKEKNGVFLEGEARIVSKGVISEEAFKY